MQKSSGRLHGAPVLARTLPIEVGGVAGGRTMRALSRSAGARFDVLAADGDDKSTVVELYDEIGFWGTTAKEFVATIKGIEGDFTLRINSPGGDVFDGLTIYNELVAHKGKIRVEVMGVAASIASIIAMAGDTVALAPNAFIMIHNAWTIAIGDKHDLRKTADTLEGIDVALARTYAQRTGMSLKAVRELMDDETWMDGPAAVAKKFADETMTKVEPKAQARFDLSAFARVPEALQVTPDDIRCETLRDAERTLREAGFSRAQTGRLIAAIKTDRAPREADAFNPTSIAEALRTWSPR